MLVVPTSWMRFGYPAGVFDAQEQTYGIHGGDVETSLMLALRPDLVDLDRAQDFKSFHTELLNTNKILTAHGRIPF